jgi:hypothetical protein
MQWIELLLQLLAALLALLTQTQRAVSRIKSTRGQKPLTESQRNRLRSAAEQLHRTAGELEELADSQHSSSSAEDSGRRPSTRPSRTRSRG